MSDINSLYLYMELIDKYPKTEDQAKKHNYKYWNTQPVVKLQEIIGREGYINNNLEPFDSVAINNKAYIKLDDRDYKNISKFISNTYKQDTIYNYYEYYTADQIKYILDSSNDSICFSVRSTDNDIILGVVMVNIRDYQVSTSPIKIADVKFFSVLKKLRGKHIGTIMIKQLTNLLLEKKVITATFKTINYIPKPFCSSRLYHRALNVKKLIETDFTELDNSVKIKNVEEALALPSNTSINISILDNSHEEDIIKSHNLLSSYMKRFSFHPNITLDDFKKTFLNNKYITSYIIRDDNEDIVDFCSTQRVIYNVKNCNKAIYSCKLYYSTAFEYTPYNIIYNLLILAKNRGYYVFSAYDIMNIEHVLFDLDFVEGKDVLNYNMYNYKLRDMEKKQICSL